MTAKSQARTVSTLDDDVTSAIEQLIRPAMESTYPVNMTRAMTKEAIQCGDRHLDELTETREIPSIQRKRGRSGSRVLYPREAVIQYLIRSAR